jgi:hypothetical protein
LSLIQGVSISIVATIKGFVYYPKDNKKYTQPQMKDFTYAIGVILGAMLVTIGIDAYFILHLHP